MGFSLSPPTLLIRFLDFVVNLVLRCLGLHAPPVPDAAVPDWYVDENLASLQLEDVDGGSWSESLKELLRVVEFSRLARRSGCGSTCVICLEEVEATAEVRELGNCGHGFHVECIDPWLDAGNLSCPLCRASMLPPPPFLFTGQHSVESS
ncbi:brassinosteroid-responsive RING protein 1-like [Zingiber officinale]|uniref:RING-type domain-containing protein n=1 Tax=Zingiber officinale TaxID=94328 RepID=A0A8J5HMI3_ZINOF|nr:brassinosteroid-responsive RING protein 1-like [Zingiber officinale]KAG6527018.1 hypothetical protein ZIOFF_009105 [Zingiber officinale]